MLFRILSILKVGCQRGAGDPWVIMRVNLLSGVLLAIAALSVFFFTAELKASKSSYASLGSLNILTNDIATEHHISLHATHSVLMSCDRAMSLPVAYLMANAERSNTADYCYATAQNIIAKMPTHGFAYFVAALAEHHREKFSSRKSLLEKSATFAPFEGWLSQRRYVLAMNPRKSELPPATNQIEHDIATLLTTQTGAELLTNYYIQRPETRELLNRVATSASTKNQTRLSNLLIKTRANQ